MFDLCTILPALNTEPGHTAVINEGVAISTNTLLTDVTQLAGRLINHQAQRWALCYKNSYQFLVAVLAVLACDYEPILLPNNHAGTLQQFATAFEAILSDMDEINATNLPNVVGEVSFTSFKPEQTITLFTSGSTGEPKKIMRSLAQFSAEINTLQHVFADEVKNTVVYSTVSHQHIYGLLFYLLWPLASKRTIVVPSLVYPENIESTLQNVANVCLISSPALLKRLLSTRIDCDRCVIFSSGGLLSQGAAEHVHNYLGLYPYEVLGSTETSGVAYRQQLKSTKWHPLPQVKVSIDAATECLHVISPFFTSDTGFVMGDGARLLENGCFELLERKDRIAKIEGKRVSLVEIENALRQLPEVQDAVVLCLNHHREYLVAIIVLTPKGQQLLATHDKLFMNNYLKDALRPYFEPVVVPKKYRYVAEIPLNSQGKMVLSELQALFENMS
jgi:acyl-coenzyme A synthetase/AMP-(fatty) acid ligase